MFLFSIFFYTAGFHCFWNLDRARFNHSLQPRPPPFSALRQFGECPLHFAAKNGHLDAANTLLQFKADVSAKQQYGRTPLHSACENGQQPVARALARVPSCDVNATDKVRGVMGIKMHICRLSLKPIASNHNTHLSVCVAVRSNAAPPG